MTQEDKELLLKDLCARLPYGIIASVRGSDEEFQHFHILGVKYGKVWVENDILRVDDFEDVEVVKPYLRSMSSMTEEEGLEYEDNRWETSLNDDEKANCIDWLNEHHFDYRGLIPLGLAIEAPDGMYGEKHEKPEKPKRIPATIEEALDILDDVLTEEDKEFLVKNGAISAHFSLGMWIRNEWKLWEPVDSDIKTYLKKEGYEHPDDMSNYIIEEFIKYLNNKP